MTGNFTTSVMVDDWNWNNDMLGLNCMNWNGKVRPAHRALYCVTLYMDHFLATSHVNYGST